MFPAIRTHTLWFFWLPVAPCLGQAPIVFEGIEGNHVAFSPDGKLLAACGRKAGTNDGIVKIWNLTECKQVFAHSEQEWEPRCLSLSSADPWIAVGFTRRRQGDIAINKIDIPVPARIWNWRTGKEVRSFQHNDNHSFLLDGVTQISFSPNGRTLATGTSLLHFWDVDAGKRRSIIRNAKYDWVDAMVFSPDGASLVSATSKLKYDKNGNLAGADTAVELWDTQSGKRKQTFDGQRDTLSLGLSSDGKLLAVGSNDKTVRIFDVPQEKLLRSFEAHSGGVFCVAFGSDSSMVFTGGNSTDRNEGNWRAWEIATGKQIHSEKAQPNVVSLAVSADGIRLATAGADGTIRVWLLEKTLGKGLK